MFRNELKYDEGRNSLTYFKCFNKASQEPILWAWAKKKKKKKKKNVDKEKVLFNRSKLNRARVVR